MKTLLLTSAGMQIKEEIIKILPKPAGQIKLAHIITASKVEKDTSYVTEEKLKMKEAGIDVEDVDLEGKIEDQVRDILKNKDVVYVQGGNTFYLLKYVKKSGFDKVIKELIEKGVIYVGVSAGSYIACPTIEAAYWKPADKNTFGLKDLTALNLVPFLLTCHYKPEYKDVLREAISRTKYPVKILTDHQAILIKGNKIELVGIGSEIRI